MRPGKGKAKLIDQWSKGNGDVIRVELIKYRGHDMISVRVWRPCRGGEDQPLKNGINLTIKHLPKLAKALRKAQKTAVEAELLDE
jgi:transcriptional coactivator p15 (PC4)